MALTIASGTDSYTASGTVINPCISTVTFPVIVLEHGLLLLQLATQTDIYSWPYGEGSSLPVNAGISPITKLRKACNRMKSDFLGGTLDYDTTVSLQATDDQDPESGEILDLRRTP